MSCLLHSSMAFAAILFVQRLQLAPQAEPFKWNVAISAPSPIVTPSTPEASVPPVPTKNTPAPALQRSTPPTTTAHPVSEPPEPRVETPAIQPPPPSAPAIDRPTPIMPMAPSPPITELAPKPAHEQTPFPKPIAKTDQVMKQPDPVTPTPYDHTPAASTVLSAKLEPPLQPTSTPLGELMPPTPIDSATTLNEPQAAQRSTTASAPLAAALAPAGQAKPTKIDYGWLSGLMARWIEDLDKRYPVMLRAEGIQGKVTLTVVLNEDGVLSDVRVATSSGSTTLDQVAVEDVRKGPPILLSRPLERPQILVKFSIIYDLKTAR